MLAATSSSTIRHIDHEFPKAKVVQPSALPALEYEHESNFDNAVGRLAFEEGLPEVDDWAEAWVWSWKGRRDNIRDDILSGRGGNMTGHLSLVLPDEGRVVGLVPKVVNDYPEFAGAVLDRDRAWLERWSAPAMIQDKDVSAWHAIEAGLPIMKAKVMYSPTRLRELMLNHTHIASCRFAWNVDMGRRHLNCNSFFQAWHVIKDLPFIKKMSDMHHYIQENLEVAPLSRNDYELAYHMLRNLLPPERIIQSKL